MNHFNYFTDVEEHFQQARSSGTFMLSPLDWTLVEVWKDSGVPIEAVHKGIDRSFEKWRGRKHKVRTINSLAYCTQEVLSAAREMKDANHNILSNRKSISAFDCNELAEYFQHVSDVVYEAGDSISQGFSKSCQEAAGSLARLASEARNNAIKDLELVEQKLTVLEEKLLASAIQSIDEDEMLRIRCELDKQLISYRKKMTTEQLFLIERQFLHRQIFEMAGLPRLSLFYLK